MRISEGIAQHSGFISLEFFPPKDRAVWPGFFQVVEQLAKLSPLFVSVTYGAGGSHRDKTLEIVTRLKQDFGLEPMAHLTCVGASAAGIERFVEELLQAGIANILALRGDPPRGEGVFVPDSQDFRHASDLVAFLRRNYPELCIGVAGYPEGHVEAASLETDLTNLKFKMDQGADFIITQLFFDNAFYWDFVSRARNVGISQPIVPGILPVASLAGVRKMTALGGASLPQKFLGALEVADAHGGNDEVTRMGAAYALEQAQDLLAQGSPGVHLYTLNRAESCLSIAQGLGRKMR